MTQPPVGPTPWPQQSPPRRPNRTLVIVLVVVVFLIVAGVGTCAVVIGRALGGSSVYFDAGNAYLAALEDGDAAAAYALLCPDVKAEASPEAFAQAVAAADRLDEHNLNSYSSSSVNGVTRREVSGTVSGDGLTGVSVALSFDGDEALVCGATVGDPRARAAVWPAGQVPR